MPSFSPRPFAYALALVNVVMIVLCIALGFHIEGTPEALERSAKGQAVAVASVPAFVASIVALIGGSRGWAKVVLGISALLTAVGIVIYLVK